MTEQEKEDLIRRYRRALVAGRMEEATTIRKAHPKLEGSFAGVFVTCALHYSKQHPDGRLFDDEFSMKKWRQP